MIDGTSRDTQMTCIHRGIESHRGRALVSETAKDWLTRKEASLYLFSIGCPVSANTLANMAGNNNAGRGPAYSRISWKVIRYHRRDLDTWVKSRVQRVA